MSFAIILNIFFTLWSSFHEIAEVNKLKAEAETAYLQGRFQLAAEKYTTLINSYNITDERVQLNLAHSCYYLNDSLNAQFHYKKLSKSALQEINSVANHQLGILAAGNKDFQTALKYFRLALKADPANEAARYNYELIRKKLEQDEKKNPDKDKSRNEKQNQDNNSEMMENDDSPSAGGKTSAGKHDDQGKSGQSEESIQNSQGSLQKSKGKGEKNKARDNSAYGDEEEQNNELRPDEKGNKEREALISQRLKLMNMSEDKAKVILEAMKNSEIQYLQQIKKRGKPRYDKDKPDW